MWCIGRITQEYRDRMYVLLDLYEQEYDELHPVICIDEKSKQFLVETRNSIAMKSGSPYKYDYEYKRNGTGNLFVAIEPKAGKRIVKVTDTRTKPDYANFIKELLEKHYPHVITMQDTFVRIWENRMSLNEDLSFNGYIFKISKNLILNKMRRKVFEPAKFETIFEHSAQDDSTENEIIYRDIKNVAERAISSLPTQRQHVYNLSRNDGLTYQEIADKLGISSRTVEVHLRKALKSIREFLYLHTDLVPFLIFTLSINY